MKYILKSLPLLGFIISLVFLYLSYQSTDHYISKLKDEIKPNYLKANYVEVMNLVAELDSTYQTSEDELKLNNAHSFYLISRAVQHKQSQPMQKDSATYYTILSNYQELVNPSVADQIASVAYNQLGVVKYPKRDTAVAAEKYDLQEIADQFRLAIEKDPQNYIAIYNYELIQRKLNNPEIILSKMRSRVHSQDFLGAKKLYENARKADRGIAHELETYKKRLDILVIIDSLSL